MKVTINLEEIDFKAIRDLTLIYIKELDQGKDTAETFWGKCAVRAVLGVINNTNKLDLDANLKDPNWKPKGQ